VLHPRDVVDAEGTVLDVPPAVRVVKEKYNLEDYLRRIFQPRACTVMFRHRLFDRFPDWFYALPTADMPLHVMNAQHGDIGFVDEVMAAYRIHPGGVWSMGFGQRNGRARPASKRCGWPRAWSP
jgi:hypothetical protein